MTKALSRLLAAWQLQVGPSIFQALAPPPSVSTSLPGFQVALSQTWLSDVEPETHESVQLSSPAMSEHKRRN